MMVLGEGQVSRYTGICLLDCGVSTLYTVNVMYHTESEKFFIFMCTLQMIMNKFGYTSADIQDNVDALTDLFGWIMFAQANGFTKKVETYLESIKRTKHALKGKKGANNDVLRRRINFLQIKAKAMFRRK